MDAKKNELMSSIIFSMMNPGIRQVLRNMTLMECPHVSCYMRAQRTQISFTLP
jgi:hypothetical protein